MKKINFDLIKIIISFTLFGLSYLMPNNLKLLFLALSYIIISYEIYRKAIKKMKKGQIFDENFLMILATIGAFIINKQEESVIVILLFQIGEYLSDLAVDNSKKKITDLMDLKIDKIHLKKGKSYEDIEIKNIKIGDVFLVKPGEKIALDGKVIAGKSYVDTSYLTGEGIPKVVEKESEVLSGYINTDSLLEICATSIYETTTAQKIINSIEEAATKKAKAEKFITKFAKIYTPIIVWIAIFLTLIPTLIGLDFNTYLYRSLIFLVTSCPCALVISVPLGYFCGIGRMSHEHILVKGSNELDILDQIEIMALDKTGTLTEGVYEVVEIESSKIEKRELIKLLSYAEYYSTHPIAKTVLNLFPEKIDENKISNFKEISGYGVILQYENQRLIVGNDKLMQQENIIYKKEKKEGTVVYIARENEFLGYIVIADKLKNTAINMIKELRHIGIKEIVILSGDQKEAVKTIGEKLHVDYYKAELLPNEKVREVEKLKEKGMVAFVGDGMNDAPVLSTSNLGISMGMSGSDIAIEASSIVIMKEDLTKINEAIKIARMTKKVVKSNIVFALLTKFIILALSLLGYTTIWLAVFADVGVTLLTILNTLKIMIIKIR